MQVENKFRKSFFIRGFFITFLVLWTISLSLPKHAYAYLNPGSGSYIFQVLIASLLGSGYIIRVNWKKIKNFFTKTIAKFHSTDDYKNS
jgi:predicted permease